MGTEGKELPAAWANQEGRAEVMLSGNSCDIRRRGEGGKGCGKIPYGIAASR